MSKEIPMAEEIKPAYPSKIDFRLQQLRFLLEDHKVEAIAVTHLPHIRYITNFSGSAGTLFITEDALYFVTDDRYEEQIKTELFPLPNMNTFISRDVWGLISNEKVLEGVVNIAFEADRIPYSDAVLIRNVLRPLKFKPVSTLVEPYTLPKAPEELACIQKASDIAVAVYEQMLGFIQPGMSEIDIAIEIAYQTRKLGSENDPFDIIVVSGPRCSLVHGKPSDRKIHKNDIIIMDFGARYNGFVTDISRTIAVGKATKDQKTLYELINNAKNAAIDNVRPSMNGKLLDAYARDMIKEAGFGDYFQHSLGHGIGLEPHEAPTITFRTEDQFIPDECVLAIEPGVYLPNKYGIRIEDVIQVTRNGAILITEAPNEIVAI